MSTFIPGINVTEFQRAAAGLPNSHTDPSASFCLSWLPKLCKVLASQAVTAAAALTRIAQQSPSVRQERVDDVVVLFCVPVDPFRSAVPHTHTHTMYTRRKGRSYSDLVQPWGVCRFIPAVNMT